MRKIIILQGLPASGKSTYSKNWVNEDPDNRVRFNNDDLRIMMGRLNGNRWNGFNNCCEQIIKDMRQAFLASAIHKKKKYYY